MCLTAELYLFCPIGRLRTDKIADSCGSQVSISFRPRSFLELSLAPEGLTFVSDKKCRIIISVCWRLAGFAVSHRENP